MSSARFDAATFAGVAGVAALDPVAAAAFAQVGCGPKQYICAPCDTKIFLSLTLLQNSGLGRAVCAPAEWPAATMPRVSRVRTRSARAARDIPPRPCLLSDARKNE